MGIIAPPTPPGTGTVPDRANRTTFPTAMYNFFTWLAGAFYTYLGNVASNVNNNATEAQTQATAAVASETNAAASAAAAAVAASAPAWVSGTTYAIGNCAFSPVDYQTYRRKTAGAGTTDPSADSTNWQRISGGSLTTTEVSGTTQTAANGYRYLLTNGSATAVTAPTAAAGVTFGVIPGNGLLTNTVDFGATTVQGLNGTTLTGVMTLDLGPMDFRYSSTLSKWVIV